MKKIFFRADASREIGSGHVTRCLNLASALRDRGAVCVFISRAHEGNLIAKTQQQGFEVLTLKEKRKGSLGNKPKQTEYIRWLGTDWKTDAMETLQVLKSSRPDWLVVDHYGLESRWEKKLRACCKKIMVIDDLADRDHSCDLLLDQNLVADLETRHQERVPPNCTLLLGNQYALLQKIYAELHPCAPPRLGSIRRLLVFFGGADHKHLVLNTIEAFLGLGRPDLFLDVVIGPAGTAWSQLKAKVKEHRQISLHENLPSLAPLMLKADLAIGGGGSTSWERCCLGLPTLVITVAENQIAIAQEMNRQGLIRWLGHKNKVSAKTILLALKKVLADQGSLADWSSRCWGCLDGKGASRVADILLLANNTSFKTRPASLSDETVLWQLKGNSTNRKKTSYPKSTDRLPHKKWFYEYLRNPDQKQIFILETAVGFLVGAAFFHLKKGLWKIKTAISNKVKIDGLKETVLKKSIHEFQRKKLGPNTFGNIKTSDKEKNIKFFKLLKKTKNKKPLIISVCSDKDSWINDYIPSLVLEFLSSGHRVEWAHNHDQLNGGDLCFYLGYGRIVQEKILKKFKNNLVVHESNLPQGRGWSPLTWQILEGKNKIPITLLEAAKKVDSGSIYKKSWLLFKGNELLPEIRQKQGETTTKLCAEFVQSYPESAEDSRPQKGRKTVYRRRTPADSQLDPSKPIRETFNLLRVADKTRYPAFFSIQGSRFIVDVKKTE